MLAAQINSLKHEGIFCCGYFIRRPPVFIEKNVRNSFSVCILFWVILIERETHTKHDSDSDAVFGAECDNRVDFFI